MTNEEFKALVKKNPIPTICAVVVLAVGLGLYFRSGDLPAAEEDLTKKTSDAEKYAANIKNAAQLKDQLDAMIAANKKIEGRLARAAQQAIGINTQYFYRLARESGVTIVAFGQSGTATKAAKAAYVPIAFNVAVTGTLPQLLDFLRQLENGAHFCRVLTGSCVVNPNLRNSPLTLSLNLELLGQP